MNMKPSKIDYVQYIWNKIQWCHWNSQKPNQKYQEECTIDMSNNEQFWVNLELHNLEDQTWCLID